jgi:hypothetical protein
LPRGFVRLVYCLAYGENELLDEAIESNKGTPQFWKIFFSCLTRKRSRPQTILSSYISVGTQLNRVGIPWGKVPQPQAHLGSKEHHRVFSAYHQVAERPGAVREICEEWFRNRCDRQEAM